MKQLLGRLLKRTIIFIFGYWVGETVPVPFESNGLTQGYWIIIFRMFSCGLGNIPPELEALARESENCVAHTDPKAPGRVTIREIKLTNEADELNAHKRQQSSQF